MIPTTRTRRVSKVAAPGPSGSVPGVLALTGAFALGALVALAGCDSGAKAASKTACVANGSSRGTSSGACTAGAPRAGARTARSGSLVVTLRVTPTVATVGSAVKIELTARASHAPGALGYLVRYGDGATSGSGAVPQFCIAGAAPPANRTWPLEHRYGARGRYAVSASVYINCTGDRATATARVLIR